MKAILKFGIAALAVVALVNLAVLDRGAPGQTSQVTTATSTDNFGSSFGTQNFFYAPGNVITPLSGFTTSWSGGGGFSTTSATYYLANTNPLLLNSVITLGSGSALWATGASSTDSNAYDIWNPSLTPLYPYFSVRSSGYIGLSTSTPLSMLTVAGNASIGADSNAAAPTNGLTVEGGILSQASSTVVGSFTTSGVEKLATTTISNEQLVIQGTGGGGDIPSSSGLIIQRTDVTNDSGHIYFSGSGSWASGASWFIVSSPTNQGAPSTWQNGFAIGRQTPIGSGITQSSQFLFITQAGLVAVGSSTPLATFQATALSANATTSVEFGKSGQNKGTCNTYFDTAGTAVYMFFPAGSVTPTYTSTKPSGCQL